MIFRRKILNKRVEIKKVKGFTLVEVMVAVFVFVMIMLASSSMFVSLAKGITKARDLQKNLESAQRAINEIPKTLRTGIIKDSTSNSITVFDRSRTTNGCIRYMFDPVNFSLKQGIVNVTESACSQVSFVATSYKNIVDAYVGDFKVITINTSSGVAGRVTIAALICRSSGCLPGDNSEKVFIQSTVSLKGGD